MHNPDAFLLADRPLGEDLDIADVAGHIATDVADVTVDTSAGITLDEISDNYINAVEQGSDLSITGSTIGVEDGQSVTVNFNGQNYTGTVSGGVFTVTFPAAELALLTDVSTYISNASTTDVAGVM